jgi:hypothetical protein
VAKHFALNKGVASTLKNPHLLFVNSGFCALLRLLIYSLGCFAFILKIKKFGKVTNMTG